MRLIPLAAILLCVWAEVEELKASHVRSAPTSQEQVSDIAWITQDNRDAICAYVSIAPCGSYLLIGLRRSLKISVHGTHVSGRSRMVAPKAGSLSETKIRSNAGYERR